ncbi:hypothetical protein [Microbacterium dextranolyticum]|uniref:Uncharacterized protein n=1 Tax=Microbacterium dextranolyticum TaxID=36806 RepID=A0A9W6M5H1_9MICO|nr:hypothetical protein [Microbacterium dextranolyticum]MBM7462236.1 hypothetical protein [Microbacterium dextranolyticum]GLJ94488.1 hypothetical protein GCM10017591_05490 [Microbacterium dextranolyticum]
MILPETVADLVDAEDEATADTSKTATPVPATSEPSARAEAAAERVRADYGRSDRWLMGLLGTVGAAIAWAVVCVGIESATTGARPAFDLAFSGMTLVAGAALGIPAVWMLTSLHRSGRRLLRAATVLSARAGHLPAPAVRPVRSLPANLLVRLATSAAAVLATLAATAVAVRGAATGEGPAFIALYVGWAALSGAASIGQFGGVRRASGLPAARATPARLH